MGLDHTPPIASPPRYDASASACLRPRSASGGSAGPAASAMRAGSAWRTRISSIGTVYGMSGIVVCGAGVCGLTTAMLLAKDGHQVTVLERDPSPPPAVDTAWDEWERRGVNQFRLPHFLLPGFREVMDAELPEVIEALIEAGASRFNPLGPFAEGMDPAGDHVIVTA